MKNVFVAVTAILLVSGCSSPSLTPKTSDVTASKENASSNCTEIGKVTGATNSVHGTPADALEDMKRETSNRGGNFVRIDQYSPYGTSVTGLAYRCK